MQYIGKILVSLACSLSLIGCLVENGAQLPAAMEGEGEVLEIQGSDQSVEDVAGDDTLVENEEGETNRAEVLVDATTVDLLSTAAEQILSQRAQALVERQLVEVQVTELARGRVSASTAVVELEQNASVQLMARRQQLLDWGEAYTSATTVIKDREATRSGDLVTLAVTELTTLAYKKIRGDEPPYTAYEAKRLFIFKQDGSRWQLIAHELAENDGPLPVTEPSVAAAVERRLSTAGAASVVRPSELSVENKKIASTTEPPALLAYNYSAMAAYAEQYWSNYNPAYRTFADVGGDCTNFVSQALHAGGWQHVSGWYRDLDLPRFGGHLKSGRNQGQQEHETEAKTKELYTRVQG